MRTILGVSLHERVFRRLPVVRPSELTESIAVLRGVGQGVRMGG